VDWVEHEVKDMNASHDHGHPSHDVNISGGPGKPALHFTPDEWEQYRKSDKGAARAVVLLMGGIFTIGLILYSTVAYICWFRVM
jgi:hypothetical protein